jgi:hypothetical protein
VNERLIRVGCEVSEKLPHAEARVRFRARREFSIACGRYTHGSHPPKDGIKKLQEAVSP